MNATFETTVRAAIARHLSVRPEKILPSHRLHEDLELDPLDLVLIALRLEDIEQTDFPIELLGTVNTVAELTRLFHTWLAASEFGAPLAPPKQPTPSSVEALLDRRRCA